MRAAVFFIAVAVLLGAAYYCFALTLDESRSVTAAVTLARNIRPSTSFALAILFFSAAVAAVFFYLSSREIVSGGNTGQGAPAPAVTPAKAASATSTDALIARLTAGDSRSSKPVKERYRVDEDFSAADDKNRF